MTMAFLTLAAVTEIRCGALSAILACRAQSIIQAYLTCSPLRLVIVIMADAMPIERRRQWDAPPPGIISAGNPAIGRGASARRAGDGAMAESELTPPPPLLIGQPVYDARSERVGSVKAAAAGANYFVMQQGRLFTHDRYVPYADIARHDGRGVYLSYPAEDVINRTSATLPVARVTAGAADTIVTPPSPGPGGDAPTQPIVDEPELTMPLHAETLVAATPSQEIASGHVRKEVITEPATVSAEVTRESLRVERVALNLPVTQLGPHAFVEQDFNLPVMGEEVRATKRARVTQEARLRKDQVHDEQVTHDTVRRERRDISEVDRLTE
jgi:uncharacterized protein (TIGR02271 family)